MSDKFRKEGNLYWAFRKANENWKAPVWVVKDTDDNHGKVILLNANMYSLEEALEYFKKDERETRWTVL